MNYRMELSKKEAEEFNSMPEKHKYFKYDQLMKQMLLEDFLSKYQEGNIEFPPTYKLDYYSNTYDQTRIPGWTDRIFYKTACEDLRLISYTADMDVKGSDHRPVFAEFLTSFLPPVQWLFYHTFLYFIVGLKKYCL